MRPRQLFEQLKQRLKGSQLTSQDLALVARLRAALRTEALILDAERGRVLALHQGLQPLRQQVRAVSLLNVLTQSQISGHSQDLLEIEGLPRPDLVNSFDSEMNRLADIKRKAEVASTQLEEETRAYLAKQKALADQQELYGPVLKGLTQQLKKSLSGAKNLFGNQIIPPQTLVVPSQFPKPLEVAFKNLQGCLGQQEEVELKLDQKHFSLRVKSVASCRQECLAELAGLRLQQALTELAKQLPVTVRVEHIRASDCLVLSLDRKCQFEQQQVFDCLLNDEVGQVMIREPASKDERSLNLRHQYYGWVQQLGRRGGGEVCARFIAALKRRLVSLAVTGYIVQQIRLNNTASFTPLILDSQRKITFRKLNFTKLAAAQYCPPQWAADSLAVGSGPDSLSVDCKQVLQRFGHGLGPQRLRCFRFSLSLPSCSVSVLVQIPKDYPSRPSFVRMETAKSKAEERKIPAELSGLVKHTSECEDSRGLSQSTLEWLEGQVNHELQGQAGGRSRWGWLALQMGRLMTLLECQQ